MQRRTGFLKLLLVVFICWLAISYLLGKFEASSDGYNEIGIPFPFYRVFNGKCFDCKQSGLLVGGLVFDVLVLMCIVLILKFLFSKRKAAQ
jgi:hypothetical protein